jgi:uncharacterized protein YihD (DUF1040 family)
MEETALIKTIVKLTEQRQPLWYFEDTSIPDFDAIFKACELYQAHWQTSEALVSSCHAQLLQALNSVVYYQCPLSDDAYHSLDYEDRESVLFLEEIKTAIEWYGQEGFDDAPAHYLLTLAAQPHVHPEIRGYALRQCCVLLLVADRITADLISLDLDEAECESGEVENTSDNPQVETLLGLLHHCLGDNLEQELKRTAILLLMAFFPNEPGTWPRVQQYILSQTSPTIDVEIPNYVSTFLNHRPEVQHWLIETLQTTRSLVVRRYCMNALDADWSDPEPLFTVALECVSDPAYSALREDALRMLIRHFKTRDEAKSAVIRALSDDNEWVRRTAIHLLAQLPLPFTDIRNLLQRCVEKDSDHQVQKAALDVLLIDPVHAESLLFWLRKCALNNHCFLIRINALEALAEIDSQSEYQYQWFTAWFENETDPRVRESLVKVMACRYKKRRGAKAWLLHIAESDPDESVRHSAKTELMFGD